jgi:hypothetical protein
MPTGKTNTRKINDNNTLEIILPRKSETFNHINVKGKKTTGFIIKNKMPTTANL